MQTWIFQGNPDEYDIDGYLASRPAQVVWLVSRYASEIALEIAHTFGGTKVNKTRLLE